MKKEKKAKNFIPKPVYEGGWQEMRKFIGKNMKYPEEAIKKKISGTVKLRYSIDYKGTVVDAKVIKGLGYGCDQEAIRLVKLLKFTVEKPRKVKVLFHKTINIHFKMQEKIQQPKSDSEKKVFQYVLTKKNDDNSENQSYSYTWNFGNKS